MSPLLSLCPIKYHSVCHYGRFMDLEQILILFCQNLKMFNLNNGGKSYVTVNYKQKFQTLLFGKYF